MFIRDQCQPAQVAYWWLTCADHWCTINANDCWCCLSDSWHWVVSEGDYEGREVAAILTTMALIEWCHPEGTVVWLIKQILFNADWKWVFGQKRLGVAPSHSSLVVFPVSILWFWMFVGANRVMWRLEPKIASLCTSLYQITTYFLMKPLCVCCSLQSVQALPAVVMRYWLLKLRLTVMIKNDTIHLVFDGLMV